VLVASELPVLVVRDAATTFEAHLVQKSILALFND
jgi:hypothetical protein